MIGAFLIVVRIDSMRPAKASGMSDRHASTLAGERENGIMNSAVSASNQGRTCQRQIAFFKT